MFLPEQHDHSSLGSHDRNCKRLLTVNTMCHSLHDVDSCASRCTDRLAFRLDHRANIITVLLENIFIGRNNVKETLIAEKGSLDKAIAAILVYAG